MSEGPPPPEQPSPTVKTPRHSAGSHRSRRRAKKAQRSTLRRRLTRTGIGVVLLVVIVVGAGVGYTFYRLDQIKRLPGAGLAPDTGKTEDILLIGSTDRCALKVQNPAYGLCSQGVNGINSDVVMIVRLDPATHAITLLSIPRDTFVPDARDGGQYNKIDAALYDGPDHLAQAIEQDFGIPINHFVVLNFDTFAGVVNALGGIRLYFPDRLYDANSGLDITHTGCQFLNGTQALEVVRSRHLYYFTKGQTMNVAAIRAAALTPAYVTTDSGGTYDPTGDLGRIIRVHLFLRALAAQVAKRGLGNVATDNALIAAVAPQLTVDDTLSDSELLRLILDFHKVSLANVPELTAPTITDAQTYYYQGYDYGDVIFPAEPQDTQTIERFMGGPLPGASRRPSSITVSVVDGTNSAATTASTAAALKAIGYHIVPTTASDYVGPISETTVVYPPGHLAQAERVEESLAGAVVLGQGKPAGGADVSVIAGSNFNVIGAPAASSTTSTTASSKQGGTTASSSTSAPASVPSTTLANPQIFDPPTPAVAPIPPWDPRACPS